MPTPSEVQREKAAAILCELLNSYADAPPAAKVEKFGIFLQRELEGVNVETFGRYRTPDLILSKALKKATLSDSDFTDVIMLSFEPNDVVRYWLDGSFHER